MPALPELNKTIATVKLMSTWPQTQILCVSWSAQYTFMAKIQVELSWVMGIPPVIIHFRSAFSRRIFIQRFWGTPISMEAPKVGFPTHPRLPTRFCAQNSMVFYGDVKLIMVLPQHIINSSSDMNHSQRISRYFAWYNSETAIIKVKSRCCITTYSPTSTHTRYCWIRNVSKSTQSRQNIYKSII